MRQDRDNPDLGDMLDAGRLVDHPAAGLGIVLIPCPDCGGTCKDPDTGERCPRCEGGGEIGVRR